MKKYEVNGVQKESAFEVDLLNDNGEMNEYFEINEEGKKKLTLSDLIGCQIKEVKNNDRVQATSGNYSKIATSENYSKIATSGNYSKIATNGYHSQVATSGYSSKVATSGYSSKVATSGDYSKVVTSGYSSKVEITGKNSVGFECGYKSTIKATDGTWISLCEYKKNEKGLTVPFFALSGQIGNDEYKDCNGKVLSEKETYILYDKKFSPVINDDGLLLIKISTKKMNDVEVIKCKGLDGEQVFCVRKDNLSSHGETLKEAMEDLLFKQMKSVEKFEIVAEIKQTGYVTRMQYRSITGACQFGTEQFAKEHGYADVEKVELKELLTKLDDKYFGAKEFKSLFCE